MKILGVILLSLLMNSLPTRGASCTDDYLRRNLQRIIQGREITIVTDPNTPPFLSRMDNGVPYGFDIELMNLISYIYKINFKYQYTTFQNLIPTVQNNSLTISISTQTITEDRIQFVNFAQFFKTGSGFIVRSNFTESITGLADLCGKKVAVQSGTIQELDAQEQNAKCGTNQITIVSLISNPSLADAVINGDADILIHDESLSPVAVIRSNGALKAVGEPYDVQPYGIVCNKGDTRLCCGLVNAINHLIRQGVYDRLLYRYSFNYKFNGICPSIINLNGTTCAPACTPSPKKCRVKLART